MAAEFVPESEMLPLTAVDRLVISRNYLRVAMEVMSGASELESYPPSSALWNAVNAMSKSMSMIEKAIKEGSTDQSRSLLTSTSAKPRRASASRTGGTRSSRSGKDPIRGKSSSRSEGRRSRSVKPRASSGRASRRKGG